MLNTLLSFISRKIYIFDKHTIQPPPPSFSVFLAVSDGYE